MFIRTSLLFLKITAQDKTMVVHEPWEKARSRATGARSGPHQKSLWYIEGQAALSLWLYTVFDQELGSIIIKLWSKDMGGMRTHYPVSGCSAKL